MANVPICDAVIHLCAVRVTRLDQLGNPSAGPNNYYTTDQQIQLAVKPEIDQGQDKTLVGGCDCIIASYRGYDKLKRFNLELDLGIMEPGLIEMLTGGAAVIDSSSRSSSGTPIGVSWPSQMDCNFPQQPNVALEGWQDLWIDDHYINTPYQYLHWLFPSSHWQISDLTLQNDFLQPKLTGYTRSNPYWGLGPYGDEPQALGVMGGFYYDTQRAVSVCGYQTHS